MLASFSHLIKRTFDERAHLVGTGTVINEVGVAAGVLMVATLLVVAAGAHTTRPCPCRYSGGIAPPGAVICLYVDGKRSLARCEMVLNNPSWRFLHQPCPIASLTRPVKPINRPPEFLGPFDTFADPVSTRALSHRPALAHPVVNRGKLVAVQQRRSS